MSLLQQMIDMQMYKYCASVQDCNAAIKEGTELLRGQSIVTEAYYDAILESMEKSGPYFVITDGIAMPHARPEKGALGTGFSLVVIGGGGVSFQHESFDPVSIIITLAAKNKEDLNEKGIVEIMDIADNEPLIARLTHTSSSEEIRDILLDI